MTATSFVRYQDSLERVPDGEQQAIDAIVASMTRESEVVASRHGHAVRASHAKSHGLLKGTLEVLPGLPEPLAQGLFAAPGRHEVLVRLATGPGEILPDSVATHRGMAIKVLGVDGPMIPGHTARTQDFVLASGPAFPQPDAAGFLASMKQLEAATPLPGAVKAAVATAARAANAVLGAVGAGSQTLDFFGHPPIHPLAETYYSQAALRFGDYVAKVAAFPASPEQVAMARTSLDVRADPNAMRHATASYLREHGAVYELRAQLCSDLAAMPVEDASVAWPEGESPYVAVARITLPAQDAYGAARQAYMDDAMSFRPAHSLAAHRPLGSLMRARLQAYAALSRFRHARNGVAAQEPQTLADVPD